MVHKIELLAIIKDERRRHPLLEICDLQKLLVQASLGGDHMLADREWLTQGLAAEWSSLPVAPPDSALPAVQPIDTDGRVMRLHLAPCKACGIAFDDLVEMLWNQPRKQGTRDRFDQLWQEALRLTRLGHSVFDLAAVEAAGFPDSLPHHSPGYGPVSYRVINDLTDPSIRVRLAEWGLL